MLRKYISFLDILFAIPLRALIVDASNHIYGEDTSTSTQYKLDDSEKREDKGERIKFYLAKKLEARIDGKEDVYERRLIFVSNWESYKKARNAMLKHQSQMVWFRWLYITMSRYMVINVLEKAL